MELSQIVEQCQQGNREAFGLLYTTCWKRLRATCLHYVQNEGLADDLLHDAFILIFTHIGELKDLSKAEVWMTTIVRNMALLNLREQKQHQQVPLTEADEPMTASPLGVTYDEIMSYIDALPDGYQRVFRLSVLEGLNHNQIAELLQIDPHSSSSQLYRAKQQLRRWLRPLLLLLLIVALPLTYWLMQKEHDQEELAQQTNGTEQQECQSKQDDAQDEPSPVASTSPALLAKPQPLAQTTQTSTDREPLPQQEKQHEVKQESLPETQEEHKPAVSPKQKSDVEWVPQQKVTSTGGWTLAMSYSGINRNQELSLPNASMDTNEAIYDSLCHHDMPLTVSLMLNRQFNKHWQLGLGLRYQLLTSDMKSGNSIASLVQHQRVQYLGIPVTLLWHQPLGRWFNTYLSATVAIDLPLRSTLESGYEISGSLIDPTNERIYPDILWSTGIGVGLQYNPVPQVGFFIEPSLQHYFKNGSGIETWNTAHPIVFSLPIGLRITF